MIDLFLVIPPFKNTEWLLYATPAMLQIYSTGEWSPAQHTGRD